MIQASLLIVDTVKQHIENMIPFVNTYIENIKMICFWKKTFLLIIKVIKKVLQMIMENTVMKKAPLHLLHQVNVHHTSSNYNPATIYPKLL